MAVVTKYIVVRDGEEKMTFATKKEADQHDKMLDIADNIHDFLKAAPLKLDEKQMEAMALHLAENAGEVIPILRGVTPHKKENPPKATAGKKTAASKTAKKGEKEKQPAASKKKGESDGA